MKHLLLGKLSAKVLAALLGVFMLFAEQTKANYVQISGVSVSGTAISFNISWENSWNVSVTPGNRDAVWLFVKYKECTNNIWYHADLLAAGHYPLAADAQLLQLDLAADSKGAFIRRRVSGITAVGNIAAQPVTLNLNIAAGSYDFKVFGIEMVSILQEDFDIGDDGTAPRFLINQTFGGVTANSRINAATQAGGIPVNNLLAASPVVANTFPMGQGAAPVGSVNGSGVLSYCMKYEISQEEYVDFLNCLTYDQQYRRTNGVTYPPNSLAGTFVFTGARSYRNGIVIVTPGTSNTQPAVYGLNHDVDGVYNEAEDGQNIACNYLNWMDFAGYLDWACLRPMTELEYEKICRGPVARLAGEYPWGNTAITCAYSYTGSNCPWGSWRVTNPGLATEVYQSTGNGLCAYVQCCGAIDGGGSGPLRCGFAATLITNQITAGAGRYGSMEMAGNVWEMLVGVNTAACTTVPYLGTLGDGSLTTTAGYEGNATNTDWPGIDATAARGVTGATAANNGFSRRGGSWVDGAIYARTSDRGSVVAITARDQYNGGRGVR